jgi:hypothetical protein
MVRNVICSYKKNPRNDPVFAMRGSMHSIQRDMIMLENQLPLFVLDRLLGLKFNNPDQKGLEAHRALIFFDLLMPTDEPLTKSDRNRLESSLGHATTFDPLSDQGGLHWRDVFRRSLLRTGPNLRPEIGSGGGQMLIVLLISDASN